MILSLLKLRYIRLRIKERRLILTEKDKKEIEEMTPEEEEYESLENTQPKETEEEPETTVVEYKGWRGKIPVAIIPFVKIGVTLLLWLGSWLTGVFDWDPIPWTEEEITQTVLVVLAMASTIYSWFTDNPVTDYGKKKNQAGKDIVGSRKQYKQAKKQSKQ